MSLAARPSRILRASSGLTGPAFQVRGLDEKIWKVLAPASTARSTAVWQPPEVPRWMPMRLRGIGLGYRGVGGYDGWTFVWFSEDGMAAVQSYKNHARFDPAFHFFVAPVLLINVIVTIVVLIHHWPEHSLLHGWLVVLALALLLTAGVARASALRAQDRVIRLEEMLRYQQVLRPDELPLTQRLSLRQVIALRFASDGELAGLVQRAIGRGHDAQGDQAGDYGVAAGSVPGVGFAACACSMVLRRRQRSWEAGWLSMSAVVWGMKPPG